MSRAMRAVSVVTCALLLWILVWVVLAPVLPSDRYSRGAAVVVAAVFLLVTIGLAWLLGRVAPWLERHPVVRRASVTTAVVTVFGVQLRTGIAIRFPPGWDAGVMEVIAHGLAYDYMTPERALPSIDFYPNNALLTALLTRWLELCRWGGVDDYEVQLVGINALVMCASIGLAYGVARRIASPVAAYLTLFLAGALLTLSPWIGVAYSDTLGMVYPIAVAWLYVRARSTRSRVVAGALWFALALVASIGYQVKPTVIFAAGAAVGVSLLGMRWRTWTRSTVAWRGAVAVALVAGFVGGGAIGDRVIAGVGLTPTAMAEEVALPPTHFLMMGAQTYNLWGAYHGDDVTLSRSIPPDERFANGLRVYRQRVSDMGALGYAEFLHEKANWTFGDGSFFAYGEGGMYNKKMPWASTDPRSKAIQNWMGPNGRHYPDVLLWWQGVWLSVLALVAAPAVWWRRRALFTPPATMLRLGVLMLTVFLLLFETRPRYLYLYLPYFFVLASVTVATLVAAAGARSRRSDLPADDDVPAGTRA